MRRPRPITIVSTSGWNRLVNFYFCHRILEVVQVESRPWRHPWWTAVEWDALAETWVAKTRPGFCISPNGEAEVVVEVEERKAPAKTLKRLGLVEGTSGRVVESFLSEDPGLDLPASLFRAIGTDAVAVTGGASEAVPEFFRDRGVVAPVIVDTTGAELVTRINGLVAERANARLLRACDLVLYHDRLQTTVTATAYADEAVLDLTLSRRPDERVGSWLSAVRQYEEAMAVESAAILTGAASDPGRDGILIATVYLLSPPGTPDGSEPDGTWQPHVKHHQYWNLLYAPRHRVVPVEPTRVAVAVPGLGGGQLGAASAIFVEAINENLAELEAALRRVENSGRFYMA